MKLFELSLLDQFTVPPSTDIFTFTGCDGMYGKCITSDNVLVFIACYTKVVKEIS